MSAAPLTAMGRWRGGEGALEVTIPITLLGASWFVAYTLLSAPTAARPFTTMELLATLGLCVAVTSWAMSRQLFMGRKRNPMSLVVTSAIVSMLIAYTVGVQARSSFKTTCTGSFEGEVVTLTPVDVADNLEAKALTAQEKGDLACRVGGVPDNAYLIGSVLRPSWNGRLSAPLIAFLLVTSVLATMGFRTVRVRPTAITFNLMGLLRYSPAAGSGSAMGKPKPKLGNVVACNNATLWGETCGQIYAKEKEWYPGEWCTRCQQAFTPAPRRFTFKIVTLFTGDVDVLNGLERVDTVSWPRGEPIAPDGRISGQERWVVLGSLEVPDIITVAQTLALVHELLPKWAASEDVRQKVAGTNAVKRASRVSCWFWRGSLSHRLTYARPTNEAILAIGPQRLRDLIEDASEELWLQLDIGLLPIEVRTGFKKTFVEEGRQPELQNSKFDLWVPVAKPHAPKSEGGLWVPRIEGDALRLWLSLDQLKDDRVKGVTIPLPYLRYDPANRGRPPEGHDRSPKPGSLDFARYGYHVSGMEPVEDRQLGASLNEWDWMEWRQIELMRQQMIVLEEARDA